MRAKGGGTQTEWMNCGIGTAIVKTERGAIFVVVVVKREIEKEKGTETLVEDRERH